MNKDGCILCQENPGNAVKTKIVWGGKMTTKMMIMVALYLFLSWAPTRRFATYIKIYCKVI